MDDRAGMVEALHERVLAVLGATPDEELALLAQTATAASGGEPASPVAPRPLVLDEHGQPLLVRVEA